MKALHLKQELLAIRSLLRKAGRGKSLEKYIRRRTEIQLLHPEFDPMLEEWRPTAEKHRHLLTGRILDAGCMNGYLYHFLGKPNGYVGVDISEEFITVAREFAPEAEFRVQDLRDVEGHFDVVWCSQVEFSKRKIDANLAYERLQSVCDRMIFMVAREHAGEFSKPHYMAGRMLVSVWEKDGKGLS